MKTRFVMDGMDKLRELGVTSREVRADAGESLFFERELESVEAALYEVEYQDLKYRELIPVSTKDGAGAQTITYYMYDKSGIAKIIANPSDDLPRSDVFAKRFTANVYSIGASFGYTTQDLRSAQMSSVPLDTLKASAAQRSIRERENTLALTGDSNYNIPGFLNNVNIPTVQAPAGASTSRTWILKTPDEILADVRTMVSGIMVATKGIHKGDTLLLPITQYNWIAQTPRSANSDTTILEFITKPGNSYGIKKIDWLNELTGAGTTATDLAILYERNNRVLEARIPMEMQSLPPQARNLEFVIPVEARNAGTVVRYPLACRSMYNI